MPVHCFSKFCGAFEDERKEQGIGSGEFHCECEAGHQYHKLLGPRERDLPQGPCPTKCKYHDETRPAFR